MHVPTIGARGFGSLRSRPMFSSLRQNLSAATLAQLAIELAWLIAAGMVVMHVAESIPGPARELVAPALVFAILILTLNGAFGIYRRGENVSAGAYALRLLRE